MVVTGQHPSLDLGAFGLAGRATLLLGCQGRSNPHLFSRDVCEAFAPFLREHRPELVLVQGDTSSELGGALAGFLTGTPVGHVEGGLRTHDPALPWPEEDNRVAIDAEADLWFAPTELSAAKLRAEQVSGSTYVTGNTAIDALASLAGPLPAASSPAPGGPRLLVTCHRRENRVDAFHPIAAALIVLADGGNRRVDVVLHPNPAQASTMKDKLEGQPGISFLQPMDHPTMITAIRSATLLLSDPGGLQEEAPALGGPLLVLRDKTERPEGIASGNMLLVGTDTARIVEEAQLLLEDPDALAAMARPALPYGDGHAAARIAAIIAHWLAARHAPAERLIA